MNERNNNIPNAVLTVLFFLVSAFFSLGLLLPGAGETAEGGEAPRLVTEDGINTGWRDDFEIWFSKHFACRDALVDTYSHLRETVFHTGNDQVIVGKDGFLFYAETVDDYTGANTMTVEEIAAAADALSNLSAYAGERGAALLFVCAPNKNTIYGGYMPDTILRDDGELETSNLTRLYRALEARGVAYVDLRQVLAERAGERLVYHRRDTHWNAEGARLAAAAICAAAGREIPEAFLSPCSGEVLFRDADLESLLYPANPKPEWDNNPSASGAYASTSENPMANRISLTGSGDGSILVFRDSFGNALIPYLGDMAEECLLSRANPYRIDWLDEGQYDLVIVEIAERNLRDLIGADARIGN